MRLLLDAHISGARVARALRERGHDVLAVDEHRSMDGATDEQLLEVAAAQGRIMVTCDVKDFPRIVTEWAEAGRRHAGCMILVGLDHREFGAIMRAVHAAAGLRPDPVDWVDYTCFLPRS